MNPGYRVQALHLYNWGGFSGRHQAFIDPANTAVVGPTGSGKTTLIDALMTLLCTNPRYNLASTGGHESDRDLVSYVRGASGPGQGGAEPDTANSHLARSGRCMSAIAAQLVRGDEGTERADSETVLIGALFWFDGSSSSVTDMSRRWCFAQGPGHSLDAWLEAHHAGGARALGQLEKSTESLKFYSSKTAYLARLQRFFDVGPNAFTLLNRAAGLKQLNSIDEIFRELVLDDQGKFDDALDVAASFDTVAQIHAELETAQRQHLALLPLRELAARERSTADTLVELRARHAALPGWFATQGLLLWRERVALHDAQLDATERDIAQAKDRQQQAQATTQALLEAYLRSGGGDVQTLEQGMAALRKTLAQQQHLLAEYRKLARNLGLPDAATVTAQVLAEHQALAAQALQQIEAGDMERQEAAEAAVTAERNAHGALHALREEHEAARRRPGSNVPHDSARFRADLADHLALPEDELPFLAELVEVQKNQQAWRGAIERALGSQRERILVPVEAMQEALRWVNQRHNRLHVRLLEASAPARPQAFLGNGFAGKLNLKPHAHQDALRLLLAELDRHCVDGADALRHTPHAMTREGLMSGAAGRFDKQDQRRLEDNWMTGFDNRDRLMHLSQQIEQAIALWQRLNGDKQEALAAQNSARMRLQLWTQLQAVRLDVLDVSGTQAELGQLQIRLTALLDPTSDAAQAKARWEVAREGSEAQAAVLAQLNATQAATQTLRYQAQRRQSDCAERVVQAAQEDPSVWDEAIAALVGPVADCEAIERQERAAHSESSRLIDAQVARLSSLHTDIVRQMGRAQKEDRGALSEAAQESDALPPYLERLRVLEEEALPDKRQRFQEYLNNTSDQGVRTLLSGIDAQVAGITDRIDELNQTLARVDFQSGRYLQLAPQPVLHASLQALNKALAHLNTERLRDDGGRAHYAALQSVVALLREHANNRRTKPAQALLDARYRLQFAVHVLDRATGEVLERRTGSQGGSGGEKEIIASYVLTASLSYALCPPGRSQPLFCTIVLDEAFSKSSPNVAARIIQALREFGLHALFVTPNKELRLLRNHTRSAVLVHRVGRSSLLNTFRWEEVDAWVAQRRGAAIDSR
ncbi:MAG: hypothetical protein EOO29_10935 [Comamonadaceae bacterium]|nr:MAG: hypothetical protein EOO29_10935 [Comamonadaceae bacterium]